MLHSTKEKRRYDMKLQRWGAYRMVYINTIFDKIFNNNTELDFNMVNMAWNDIGKELMLKVYNQPDVNSSSTYDYEISLTTDDIQHIIDFLSNNISDKARNSLSPKLNAILLLNGSKV